MAEPHKVTPDDQPFATPPLPAEGVRDQRILIADDDRLVRRSIAGLLRVYGYGTLEAADGLAALRLVFEEKPDLVILDIEMPELGGLAVLRRMREAGSTTPVLILSSNAEVSDRVEGLSLGADDYLGKPFHPDELRARVKALTRRHQALVPPPRSFRLGEALVDLDRMVVERAGTTVRLSRTECSILELLSRNEGRPVSRTLMMDVVWGYASAPNTRTIDTHIWRLRKKIGDLGDEPQRIRNVPGVGYQLTLDG